MNALDAGGNYAAGARPSLASAIDTDVNDQLIMKPGSAPGTFKITFAANPNKCLDHPLSTADGTVMQVWDCNGGTNQNWTFSNAQNGGIVVKNQYSGKCLDTGRPSRATTWRRSSPRPAPTRASLRTPRKSGRSPPPRTSS